VNGREGNWLVLFFQSIQIPEWRRDEWRSVKEKGIYYLPRRKRLFNGNAECTVKNRNLRIGTTCI
jgi:hypothetical protein